MCYIICFTKEDGINFWRRTSSEEKKNEWVEDFKQRKLEFFVFTESGALESHYKRQG